MDIVNKDEDDKDDENKESEDKEGFYITVNLDIRFIMSKDKIQENLVNKGRELIRTKGAEFLTARKLSDASGYSVGTIYNQFGNMDNFDTLVTYGNMCLADYQAQLEVSQMSATIKM